MRPTAAKMKKSKDYDQARKSRSDLKSSAQTKSSAILRNENDWAADFIVGALLYSLLGSSRSESVSVLLPDGEQD